MKRKLVGFVLGLGVAVSVLTACSLQKQVVVVTEATAAEEEIYHGMGMANPWVDSDRAGVLAATGFALTAPEQAANVAYSYMPDTGMAQLNYTMNNAMWVYRMQPAEALEDISGIYCEWNYTGAAKVAGMDAMEYGYASKPEGDSLDGVEYTRVILWYDAQNKVTHSLAVMGIDLNGMDTAVYAENLFRLASDAPVGGEARDTELYRSFLGLHVCSYDGSNITVEEDKENGGLKVVVDLFRLCSLDDGVGSYENGVVSFHATDPACNPISCSLFYNSENSLCLKIEETTWTYFTTGQVIDGFDD